MENYFLVIDKPAGITSFDVIRKARKVLGTKKIGHMGTLDPFAIGVLPLAVNKATKLIQYLQDEKKEYIAEFVLGKTSATGDCDGEITEKTVKSDLTTEEIESSLEQFVGEIMQMPPKVSAIKVDGKRAYDLAREGVEFSLKERMVFVESIEVLFYAWPLLRLRIVCGKGFYVRSLANDLGEVLGVGAYVQTLERTFVGFFKNDQSVNLTALERGNWEFAKISLLEAWELRPRYFLSDIQWQNLKQGRFIPFDHQPIFDITAGILNDEMVCLLEPIKGRGGLMKMAVSLVDGE